MPPPASSSLPLIAGRFTVHPDKPMPEAGGGLPAFLATSQDAADGAHIGIMVARDASPRVEALRMITDHIDCLMTPGGHGVGPAPNGGETCYIIYSAPPGPPLSAGTTRWTDRALIDQVLKPTARILLTLQGMGLTHRAIRPDNVFLEGPGQLVTLGAAWATPPAMHQPTLFETPYTAMCEPVARGPGTIADDVYALGVLMMCLAAGKTPCEGMTDEEIIRAKLGLGSFAALSRDLRLSGFMTDLLSGLLAEDPDHRPSPKLLLDPNAARARRVASSPARRSHDPLQLGDLVLHDARTVAYAMFKDERRAIQALRNPTISTWLRRSLGDAGVAQKIEDLVRKRMAETRPDPRSDARLLMRAIAVLDPRMPVCWRGVAMRPDGAAGLLSAAIGDDPKMLSIIQEIFIHDIIEIWATSHRFDKPYRSKRSARVVAACQRLAADGVPDALLRMFYRVNPMLPCAAPAMARDWIVDVPSLLTALDKAAPAAKGSLLDPPLIAFISARAEEDVEPQLRALATAQTEDDRRRTEISLLRALQAGHGAGPLQALTAWAAKRLTPAVESWRNRPHRQQIAARLGELAKAGDLAPILDLLFNRIRREQDAAGERLAIERLASIDAEIRAIDEDDTARALVARHFGAVIVAGGGLVVLILRALALMTP
ncbi:MAG TPA: hypothetical protein VHB27_08350 [Rhodopila sp.]|uniref:protein kinase domain-containing protein n=1 Tax=Rhodopila sp. TaxID=2480087 RepID=UPI002CC84AF4|nr:hypothetical protein [Rhodopila sp.]HVY15223.1 hypothetical protein [Rhodopila sp.]